MNEKYLGSTLDDFLLEEGRLDEAEAVAAERIRGYQAASSYAPFDAADYLDDEETIVEYLANAREDPNPEVLQAAVQDVLRARLRARDAAPPGASETMLAIEAVLRRDWDRPEEDRAWTNL